MAIGRLEAEVLGAVQLLGKATARQVMEKVGRRHLAYTTVSTVLDRLYKKGMVARTRVVGRGGRKYLYQTASSPALRLSIVNMALDRLVNAFGPSIVPTIYDSLDKISKEEIEDIRSKIAKARGK